MTAQKWRRRGALIIGLAILYILSPDPTHAATLVNDPTNPLPAQQLARLQQTADQSHLPTLPGTIILSGGVTEVLAASLAGDHYIQLNPGSRTPFALMHELGHESQMFDGPGSTTYGPNYGTRAGWSDQKIQTLARLLHAPFRSWGDEDADPRLDELSADAYAQCALHPRWYRWWGNWKGKAHPGRTRTWIDTSTPYDFRAGPARYHAICTTLREES